MTTLGSPVAHVERAAAGPVLGSLFGEWLILLNWRWPLRLMTILVGINTCCVILFMRETYAPVLERKWLAERLASETGEKGEADAVAASAAPRPEFRELIVRTFTVSRAVVTESMCTG